MAALLVGVLWWREAAIWPVFNALVVATVFQVLVKRFTRWWPARRPFSMGLCGNHLGHSDRGGMPSTHAAVMACVAGAMWPWYTAWPELHALPVIAVLTAWARVHAGAHFPSDVLLGLLLGGGVGFGAAHAATWI